MAGSIYNPVTTSIPDSQTNPNNLFGRAGEQLSADLHGKYYTYNYRGQLFWATTIAATAPAVYTATAVTSMGLWNPANSGKNLVLARTILSPVTAASAAVTVGYAVVQNAGSSVATAAPISVFANIAAGLRGSGLTGVVGSGSSVALCGSSATVLAPTVFMPALSWTTDVITTSAEGNQLIDDPEGRIIIQPGTAIFVASSATNTGTANYSMYWYEVPV